MTRPAELTTAHLLDQLVAANLLSAEQAREIRLRERALRQRLLTEREAAGRTRDPITPPELLASLELAMPDGRRLSEDRIMELVAGDVGMPYLKLDPLELDGKLITDTFSRPFATHNVLLPVKRDGTRIVLAVADPYNVMFLEQLRRTLPFEPTFVVSSKTDILKSITETYGFRSSVSAAASERGGGAELGNLEQLVSLKQVDEIDAEDAPIVNAVEYLLHYAFGQRASDIHIEPKREETIVRLRIDGILHTVYRMPRVVHGPFVSRIKMLARMDIAEKRRPQDGRIKTSHQGAEIELRVSSLPVAFGEKLVIRIFDPQHLLQDLGTLGMHAEDLARYHTFIGQSTGLILVTGPTGSGKTTTLYSSLRYLEGPGVNVTTIEDPIEMVYESFNQVQVQSKIGLTFDTALRTVLRQDPDVVMVGEIRDAETAEMAIQGALTGHLVLSTLHTNDAPSTISRLLDLDVRPFLLASTLVGVVAQRLLRTICPDCKVGTALTEDQIAALDLKLPKNQKRRLEIKRGSGCSTCRYTGLLGRTAVFEVMAVNATVRRLIAEEADSREIMKAARADGMLTLKEAAIRTMARGETTFDEVVRVLGTTGGV